jgi:4'-phosphopantetheinyl transferase
VKQLNDKAASICIWTLRTHHQPHVEQRFACLLSADEQDRASRFLVEGLRQRFVLIRGALRILLASQTGVAPEKLVFAYGEKGKPRLEGDCGIFFNISHSKDLAVMAFSCEVEMGVDVEHVRRMPDMRQIAERFFSRGEAGELSSLPPEWQQEAFFRCWSRKEALLKATGDGLSAALDAFQVSLRPEEPARVKQPPPGAGGPWCLHDLATEQGYASAIAYQGVPRELEQRCVEDAGDLARLL